MEDPRYADALTLDQLEIFVEVAHARSFTGAAQRLRRAQSAVSYGVARLEQLLGVQLFERSKSGARLTAEGQILLVEARSILDRVDHLRAAGVAFGEHVEPELTISVSPIMALELLAAVAVEFRERFPHTHLRVYGGNLGANLQDVESGRATIGFTGLDVPAGFAAVTCGHAVMVRVVGPTHALASRRRTVSEAELKKHLQLIAMDTTERTKDVQINVLSPRTWRIGDTMVRYQMVLAGVGWTHFPRAWIADDLAAGRLIELPLGKGQRPSTFAVRAFYRIAAPPGPAGRWLLTRLCEASAPAPSSLAGGERSSARPPGKDRRRRRGRSG